MKVGIIGFGRLGKLATQNLSQDFSLYVYDKENYKEEIQSLGATPASLEEVANLPIVIPLVPISEFGSVIDEIAPFLKKGATVIDVCSVKTYPVQVMKKKLPKDIQIMGTHPMFGPDSAKETLFGTKMAVCPVRISKEDSQKIISYLERNGIKIVETTPREHDQQIAHTLLLTHFLGRGLLSFGATPFEIDTKGYRRLMKILLTVKNDSWQLFKDMNRYNPYAGETREGFLKCLKDLDEQVDDSLDLSQSDE